MYLSRVLLTHTHTHTLKHTVTRAHTFLEHKLYIDENNGRNSRIWIVVIIVHGI